MLETSDKDHPSGDGNQPLVMVIAGTQRLSISSGSSVWEWWGKDGAAAGGTYVHIQCTRGSVLV
jgi:hypothetical protein